jgi:peroxiredoxin Q/BCP
MNNIQIEVGEKAPDFSLLSDTGERVTLSQFFGQKKVLIYFYPKDHTPGCTQEACDFRDQSLFFNHQQVEIIGISKDKPATHAKFKQKHQLPFRLLADENGDVCEAYGVINKKSLFGKTFLGIQRSTFLIDEQGIIRAIWRKVKVKEHVEQIIHALT